MSENIPALFERYLKGELTQEQMLSACAAEVDRYNELYGAFYKLNIEARNKREHRRYEIARDCMAAYCGNTDQSVWRESSEKLASWSVECADALLSELEKKP